MKDKKKIIKLVIILIIICLLLLGLVLVITYYNNASLIDSSDDGTGNIVSTHKDSLRDVLDNYNCTLNSTDTISNSLYISFDRGLYDDKGNSNEAYFNQLVSSLSPLYEQKAFYLRDTDKDISIHVVWDSDLERHVISDINGISNFYEDTNGEAYSSVDNVEPVPRYYFMPQEYFLDYLAINDFYFSNIKKKIGEVTKEEDGYQYYLDNSLKIKLLPNLYVYNVVFNDLYEDNIIANINVNMTLQQKYNKMKEKKIEVEFGNISDGYIGFVADSFYYFMYEDEISAYAYTDDDYSYEFYDIINPYVEAYERYEQHLSEENYDNTKAKAELMIAFDNLRDKLNNTFKCYDLYDYDAESGKLRFRYAMLGIDFNIENFDPIGITLYNNFTYSDELKQMIKDGKISINASRDLIEVVELERKGNN